MSARLCGPNETFASLDAEVGAISEFLIGGFLSSIDIAAQKSNRRYLILFRFRHYCRNSPVSSNELKFIL